MVNGYNYFAFRQLEFFADSFNNTDVGLMRKQPVNIGYVNTGQFGNFFGSLCQAADGAFENFLAVHKGKAGSLRAGHAALAVQVVVLGAVRKDFCTQDTAVGSVSFTLTGADNNGSGAISEQNDPSSR